MAEVNSSSTKRNAGARGSSASNAGPSASSAASVGANDMRTNDSKTNNEAKAQSATAQEGEQGGASNGSSRSDGATRFTRATDALGDVAYAVRQTTQGLRDRNHETIAGYVEQGAQQLEQLAQRLNDRNVTELLRDARRLAHRQPALFVGSAFAIGLFGARFLKSSPSDESHTNDVRNPGRTYGGYGDPGTAFSGSPNRDEYAHGSSLPRQDGASQSSEPSSSPLDEPGRV
jgi:hypothetical protein